MDFLSTNTSNLSLAKFTAPSVDITNVFKRSSALTGNITLLRILFFMLLKILSTEAEVPIS